MEKQVVENDHFATDTYVESSCLTFKRSTMLETNHSSVKLEVNLKIKKQKKMMHFGLEAKR